MHLLYTYKKIKKLFGPLDDIQKGAAHFAKGDFSYPIPVEAKGQLADLVLSIKEMGSELQNRLDSKRELLLAMAHELRSPLTRIRLHTELLEDARKEDIHHDLDEMNQLVQDILEAEGLHQGHEVLQKSPRSLDELLKSLLSQDFQGFQVDLQTTPFSLEIDPLRYRIALKNLIKNSLDHGSGEVCIAQDEKRILISNSCKALTQEEISKLTDPFYRLDQARTPSQGMGMGLYLVSKILKAHGHDLKIESKEGKLWVEVVFEVPHKEV